jgi:hypothetical protein
LCHIHLLFASDWDAHIRPWERARVSRALSSTFSKSCARKP